MQKTDDLRIREIKEVRSPSAVHQEFPISEAAAETVYSTRHAIQQILHGRDDRLLVVAGPCSVHDPRAALEYAQRLRLIRDELSDRWLLIMRVYFEK
ncbi:MAG TPA: 3-deoxy-7-phosphoheptulonate synthase, partial [Thiocapsa sp.]|nr:3-deoxy-7-phosphoheptulonate synthase [Thiocapsa sp.]